MKVNKIRLLVTTLIEIESELPSKEAIEEFQENSMYNYEDTENVKVIQTEWRDQEILSILTYNK